jgi:transposase InsO family protein
MSKQRVVVLSIVHQGLSVTEAAHTHGMSRQHIYRLLKRYKEGGIDAVEPRSTKPHSSPHAASEKIRLRIVQLRIALDRAGLDHGPMSIQTYLAIEGHTPPATSTIRRVLNAAGLVTPEPKKRPKSSIVRFEADQPNETWQSDFTHWRLANGQDVEILNWLDDHSRMLLSITVYDRVTGMNVMDTFTDNINVYGPPWSSLTYNGSVYTSRFTGRKNGFEYLLSTLGIRQKNGSPSHPQTQGKIERFHQTLKKWLSKQEPATNLKTLQSQLDEFQNIYNTQRPHRALSGRTPQQAYNATVKAGPNAASIAYDWRIRHDYIDKNGKLGLRRAGVMHHLGVGKDHARKRVLILVDQTKAIVTEEHTGEILSEHLIEPEKNYWRNQLRNPGRWPGFSSNM